MRPLLFVSLLIFSGSKLHSQPFPDQQITLCREDLRGAIDESHNLEIDNPNYSITLLPDQVSGYFITMPLEFDHLFNHGLPSWNGSSPGSASSFKVQMSFEMDYGWSSWVTVGFWNKNIWSSYGLTSFTGGKVSIDEVKLYQYISRAKFKVIFQRSSTNYKSPCVHQLSLFVSDTETTANVNITEIVNDRPPEIFIPTEFIYQYGVPDIGPRICSPSTTAMILKSYNIEVDIYDFAMRTLDTKWDLFGVWPRNVQHGTEYALKGSVTRYRDWSSAYEVLNNGGRIAMSLGTPMYPSGHLVMLAGFDEQGNPLIHNPARTNGYSQLANNVELAQSWFNKGGISYTFYPDDYVPEAPVIYSPVQDQNFLVTNPIEVNWSKLPRTTGYLVEVSTDIEGTNIIESDIKYSKTDTTMIYTSLSEGEYYLNVTGTKIGGTGNWVQVKFIVDDITGIHDEEFNKNRLSVSYLNKSEIIISIDGTGLKTYNLKMYDLYGHELTLPASNKQATIETFLLNRNNLPSFGIIVLESHGKIEYIKIPGL
ncbi:MAG: C39 family peptidase [Bacteroidota bacterium]